MRPLVTVCLCAIMALGNLSCSVNILETFARKDSNEALYEDALKQVNDHDYDGALSTIASMTDDYPALAKVLELKASAYGGKCGFIFLDFTQALGNMGTTRLFPFLMQNFIATATTSLDACSDAIDTITSIGATAARTTNQNFFMAMVAFAKIGNILNYYGDANGDGTVTAGFDPCAVGGARTHGGNIADADARELGAALSVALENLTAVASSVNLGSGSLTSITGICTTLTGLGVNICNKTDPTAFSAAEVKGIRSVIAENNVLGLASTVSNAPAVCPGDITQCFCP